MDNCTIKVLRLFILLTFLSCERKGGEAVENQLSKKQIKILIESIHDPLVTTGKVEYNPKNSSSSVIAKSLFNSNGSLASKSIYNSLGNLKSKVAFQYDKKGNVTQTNFYSSNGVLSRKKINFFDPQDKLIESKEFDDKGKQSEKQIVNFNNDGHKVITTFKVKGGNFVKASESVFNSQGLNIENYYFTNETLVRSEINRYDTNGNKIETSEFDPSNNTEKVTHYKFDDQNNNTEVVELNSSLMITSKVICKFNDKRELTDSMTIGILGNIKRHVRYMYTYDEATNWVQKISFVNNQPVSVTLHRIEYY